VRQILLLNSAPYVNLAFCEEPDISVLAQFWHS